MNLQPCPKDLLDFAQTLADAVAEVHRHHFRRPVRVEMKPDSTPVTEVDQEAERVVRELIRRTHPDHGIIGEEFPAERADAQWLWVIDPLDGTKLFLSGVPLFGTLIGLAHHRRFVLGLIDHAALGERWLGADGYGTTWNGEPVNTQACADLSEAVVCRPGIADHTLGRDADIDRASEGARWVHWGVTPYHVGLLASGFVDLIVTAGPKLHDLAPIDPIVRNAGGVATDWSGAGLDLSSRDLLLAAGDPALARQVLGRLKG